MKISQISMASNAVSFKSNNMEPKPIVDIEGKKDSDVVMFSTWGSNYAYPVTAGDIKAVTEAKRELNAAQSQAHYDETPEQYYERKLYSTEWCM